MSVLWFLADLGCSLSCESLLDGRANSIGCRPFETLGDEGMEWVCVEERLCLCWSRSAAALVDIPLLDNSLPWSESVDLRGGAI